jgi:hypothetical protein
VKQNEGGDEEVEQPLEACHYIEARSIKPVEQ